MKHTARRLLHAIGPLHRALSRRRGTLIHQVDPVQVRSLRLGSDYGGWVVVPELLNSGSIVYSFGVGSDISFDLDLIARYGCEIHGFDPTPTANRWVKAQITPKLFVFHSVGLASTDGMEKFLSPESEELDSFGTVTKDTPDDKVVECPVRRLASIANDLGHKRINLLKMDIEGFEYAVLDDVLASPLAIDQLLVEFHHGMYGWAAADTQRAVEKLRRKGYLLFSVSNVGREYSFVHKDAL